MTNPRAAVRSQVGVEGDRSERHDRPHARQCEQFGVEMRQAIEDFLGSRLVVGRRTTHGGGDERVGQRQPIVTMPSKSGMLAKPVRWRAAIRKSPEPPTPSPVKTRPVRLAPCAAGARPTMRTRAAGRRTRARAAPSTRHRDIGAALFLADAAGSIRRSRGHRSHATIVVPRPASSGRHPGAGLTGLARADLRYSLVPCRLPVTIWESVYSVRDHSPARTSSATDCPRSRRDQRKESVPVKNLAPKDAAELDAVERREWLESLDYVLQSGGPVKVARLLRDLSIHATQSGVKLPFTANTPYVNTIAADEQAPMPGSPGHRAPHQEPGSLECGGHGRPGQQGRRGHRRAHLDVRVGGHAVRSRLQSFLPRPRQRRRRHHLLPGPRRARHLRARVSRRPADRARPRELPPRAARRAAACRRIRTRG